MKPKYEWEGAEPFLVGALFFVNDHEGVACWFEAERVTVGSAWPHDSIKDGMNVLVIDRDGHKLRVLSEFGPVWISEYTLLQHSTRLDE